MTGNASATSSPCWHASSAICALAGQARPVRRRAADAAGSVPGRSAHDFGGHRARALDALDDALTQVEKALRAVDDNVKGVDPGKDAYKHYVNHPHIRHALVEAMAARTELKEAAHDYKGHRAKAVDALDAVIDQLDKALKYAR
jgi:hypothetical protein